MLLPIQSPNNGNVQEVVFLELEGTHKDHRVQMCIPACSVLLLPILSSLLANISKVKVVHTGCGCNVVQREGYVQFAVHHAHNAEIAHCAI